MSPILHHFLMGCCILLGVGVILSMIRAVCGPRFTDRIVAVNMISTMTIVIMCILSVFLDADFLVDVCITYALLGFIAIVVLTRLVIIRRRGQQERELAESGHTTGEDLETAAGGEQGC